MTATPITWRRAPARARLALTTAALWARTRRTVTARARRATPGFRRVMSTGLELAAGAAFVWGAWQIAAWAGGFALAAVLAVTGVLVAPAGEVDDQ